MGALTQGRLIHYIPDKKLYLAIVSDNSGEVMDSEIMLVKNEMMAIMLVEMDVIQHEKLKLGVVDMVEH